MTEPSSEDPQVTPDEVLADQIRSIASDLATLAQRATDEADAGDIPTARETLGQADGLFTAARDAGILPESTP